jgi:hypothetical protein
MLQNISSVVRHALTLLAGGLIAKGYVDAAMVEAFTGAVVTLAALAWSFYEKRKAAKNV